MKVVNNHNQIPLFVHIGWMRTGSTSLQNLFLKDAEINLSLKNRYFLYDPYYCKGKEYYYDGSVSNVDKKQKITIDSDECYSVGRFKKRLRELNNNKFNLKTELHVISHNIPEMVNRIKETIPNAKYLVSLGIKSIGFYLCTNTMFFLMRLNVILMNF